jgi:hypothetical protein
MKLSGETLIAYAAGAVDGRARRPGASTLRHAPGAARITRHRTLRTALRTAFVPILQDALPQRSNAAADASEVEPRPTQHWVAALRPAHLAAITGGIALVAGLLMGQAVNLAPSATVTTQAGRMLASGALAIALTEQEGGIEPFQSEVVVGLSYLAKSGNYCRTFTVKQSESMAGIACHEADGWHIQALAQTGPKSPLTQYRMAGTSVPPLLMGMVESTIDGRPLDTETEAAARQQQWRR